MRWVERRKGAFGSFESITGHYQKTKNSFFSKNSPLAKTTFLKTGRDRDEDRIAERYKPYFMQVACCRLFAGILQIFCRLIDI